MGCISQDSGRFYRVTIIAMAVNATVAAMAMVLITKSLFERAFRADAAAVVGIRIAAMVRRLA